MPKLILWVVRFVVSLALISATWGYWGPLYNTAVVTAANRAQQVTGLGAVEITTAPDGTLHVYKQAGGNRRSAQTYTGFLFFNVALLLSLILATPGVLALVRIKQFCISMTILFALNTTHLILDAQYLYVYKLTYDYDYFTRDLNADTALAALKITADALQSFGPFVLWAAFNLRSFTGTATQITGKAASERPQASPC